MSELDAAYLAAFFDGEGSAFFTVGHSSGGLILVISIGNTHLQVIEHIQRMVGMGAVVERKGKGGHRPLYMWRCFSQAANDLLHQLLPFLIIKRNVAQFAVETWGERMNDLRLRIDPTWRRRVLETSKDLNKKGRRLTVDVEFRRWQMTMKSLRRKQPTAGIVYRPVSLLGVAAYASTQRSWQSGVNMQLDTRLRESILCRRISSQSAARIAGYLDGEGCIRISQAYNTVVTHIFFGNRDPEVVSWLKQTTGVGWVYGSRSRDPRNAPFYLWVCRGRAAHGLLEQVYQYLIVKQRQAKLAMYVEERLLHPEHRKHVDWQREAIAVSRELNRRGGPWPEHLIAIAGGILKL